MRWTRASAIIFCAGLLGCGDDGQTDAEAGTEDETTQGDGDGDGEPGDGDGEPGDGDGEPGDGDGEPGDGDGEPGDGDGEPGDGDGEPGDGDGEPGDGDGEPGDGDGEPGDGDGEPGDGDGDGEVCDSADFLGAGIADDQWGLGDFCDEIYVCVNNLDYDELVELLGIPDEDCMSDLGCGDGQRCVLSWSTIVDEQVMTDACAALTIVDSVWCAVWGP
ncbi:MAG TPA: hypothetical protein VK034_26540 [Enhygromyxa sp.]|nr:hypothetical protein [Enhygromyxa sp.]